ncbi:DinB family protein [Crateriforma conspicua]|uniref:DinB superfamily protein n=1 Tax=Crateriforma conspicua TaxID=2527996 RepID=A0A5C5YD20_9PLAN|nr:DinB family protein [Crateriforma conspicua]TWT71212.1 DinB superfamily protein [Crateriforma conspicua]
MNAKDAIRYSMQLSDQVFKSYLSDFDDGEIMNRPGEGCNHIAWQLGHLISSEVQLLQQACPGQGIELPDGFAEAHSKEQVGCDDQTNFHSLGEYLELYDQVRAASAKALDAMSDDQLSAAGPEAMREFCPTVGSLFTLIATHPMMHAGQIVPIRRRLNKPILF